MRTGGGQAASVTLFEQSSFQSLGVPARFPGDGNSPIYRAFPEVVKINISGSGGSEVLIEIPATASTFRESGEVHLRGRDVLDRCMEANQGSVGVNIRRIVEREWWDLLSKPELPGTIAYNGH